MDSLSPKQIADIAKTCRKAGITSFKGFGIEFTLAPETQSKVVNKRPKVNPETKTSDSGEIETDSPTADELLFWSVGAETESNT